MVESLAPSLEDTNIIIVTLGLFFLAALMEIGGGYLVWQWIREKKGVIIGFIEGHSFIFMWYNSYTPTISFWKNLCRVRRYIHYFVNRMGNDCG
jgi:hypothetical protein